MSFLAPLIPTTLGGLAAAGATVLSLGGAASSGRAEKDAAKAQQQQLNYNAGQAEASSQHAAEAARRKSELMLSRGIAVGAASGAGTGGIERILQGITEEGEIAASGTLYEGAEKAKSLRYQGEVGVANAKAKANATMLSAVGGAVGTAFARFDPSRGVAAKATSTTRGLFGWIPTQAAATIESRGR